MPERVLVFTDSADKTIYNMRMYVNNIGLFYGIASKQYTDASNSLMNCLAQMIHLGGKISSDGDLDLYCVTQNITYGVNFHSGQKSENEDAPIPGTWSINS
jgi:hypothetical protein